MGAGAAPGKAQAKRGASPPRTQQMGPAPRTPGLRGQAAAGVSPAIVPSERHEAAFQKAPRGDVADRRGAGGQRRRDPATRWGIGHGSRQPGQGPLGPAPSLATAAPSRPAAAFPRASLTFAVSYQVGCAQLCSWSMSVPYPDTGTPRVVSPLDRRSLPAAQGVPGGAPSPGAGRVQPSRARPSPRAPYLHVLGCRPRSAPRRSGCAPRSAPRRSRCAPRSAPRRSGSARPVLRPGGRAARGWAGPVSARGGGGGGLWGEGRMEEGQEPGDQG